MATDLLNCVFSGDWKPYNSNNNDTNNNDNDDDDDDGDDNNNNNDNNNNHYQKIGRNDTGRTAFSGSKDVTTT